MDNNSQVKVTLNVLYIAFTLSRFIFYGVAIFIILPDSVQEVSQNLAYVFISIGIVMAAVSQFLYSKTSTKTGLISISRLLGKSVSLTEFHSIEDGEIIKHYMPIIIISWAISEAIAIVGIVSIFVGVGPSAVHILCTGSIIQGAYQRPRLDSLLRSN